MDSRTSESIFKELTSNCLQVNRKKTSKINEESKLFEPEHTPAFKVDKCVLDFNHVPLEFVMVYKYYLTYRTKIKSLFIETNHYYPIGNFECDDLFVLSDVLINNIMCIPLDQTKQFDDNTQLCLIKKEKDGNEILSSDLKIAKLHVGKRTFQIKAKENLIHVFTNQEDIKRFEEIQLQLHEVNFTLLIPPDFTYFLSSDSKLLVILNPDHTKKLNIQIQTSAHTNKITLGLTEEYDLKQPDFMEQNIVLWGYACHPFCPENMEFLGDKFICYRDAKKKGLENNEIIDQLDIESPIARSKLITTLDMFHKLKPNKKILVNNIQIRTDVAETNQVHYNVLTDQSFVFDKKTNNTIWTFKTNPVVPIEKFISDAFDTIIQNMRLLKESIQSCDDVFHQKQIINNVEFEPIGDSYFISFVEHSMLMNLIGKIKGPQLENFVVCEDNTFKIRLDRSDSEWKKKLMRHIGFVTQTYEFMKKHMKI